MSDHGLSDLTPQLVSVGRGAGLAEVGVCSAEPFVEERRALRERREVGLHGGMQFTYRNPERSTDPSRTLPGVRSLVVGALHYARPVDPPPGRAVGRVARYANEDHYRLLRDALEAVASVLRDDGRRAVVVADQNALVDRAVAVRAGIGWYGRNSNVLLAGRGSWFVLGSVLTDAELVPTEPSALEGCGTCRRCGDSCPTGAIVADGVVDARRCLAWHLQMDGEFPHEYREALGGRIYGCDDCQEVCPPNRRSGVPTGAGPHGAGPGPGDPGPGPGDGDGDPGDRSPGDWVDLRWMLRASDEELMGRLGRWYVPRRDPRYLRRNALVALGNVGDAQDPATVAVLVDHLSGDDELLAGHAAWALLRLGRRDLVVQRQGSAAVDGELRRWPSGDAAATMAPDGSR